MTLALDDDDTGHIGTSAIGQILDAVPRFNCVAIGPGLGQSDGVRQVVRDLQQQVTLPMVIDADGLNALAKQMPLLGGADRQGPRILTPHPGEFARLIDSDTQSVQAQREDLAVRFAQQHEVVLVLKGAGTIITDGQRLAHNATGGVGLATGGSGDVLTGLIASLVSQGMTPFEAAQFGAHLHGLAGDLMAQHLTDRYATSLDLLDFLSHAWRRLAG